MRCGCDLAPNARCLQWLILANLAFACILLIGGDEANAMLGLAGSAFFALALLLTEGRP